MNSLVEKVIENIPSDVFSDTTLRQLIPGTDAGRYGQVKRAIQSGQILHLRRGLYALSKKFQRRPCNLYEIAQRIYGPSYVSFESALSYHGWIPEAVYTVTSAAAKRSAEFETPLGLFSYSHIPSNMFFAGVQRVEAEGSAFLIAAPWRALADYVYIHKKNWRGTQPLIEDLRIDETRFQAVDFRLLEELYRAAKSTKVKRFITGVKKELLK